MQSLYQRPHKIELTISRRKKQILSQSLSVPAADTHQPRNQKWAARRMDVTISSRFTLINVKPKSGSLSCLNQHSKMAVSQFMIDSSKHQNLQSMGQSSSMLYSVREIQHNEDQDNWWQYIRQGEEDSNADMVRQLAKKIKKIQYFQQLLAKNTRTFEVQKRQAVRKYESYMDKIRQLYAEQLQQALKLGIIVKELDDKNSDEFYRALRLKINKDGKKGLNFSPKRMSLFSGIAGTLLLSNKSSGSQQRRRVSNEFSFGSSLQKNTNDESLLKQMNENTLLERASVGDYKKRKLLYSNT